MNKIGWILFYLFIIVVGSYFAFLGLAEVQAFLAPLIIAVLLVMLVLPIAGKLEKWGMTRGLAAFFADVALMIATLTFVFVLGVQVSLVSGDWDKITKQMEPKINNTISNLERKTGIQLDKMFAMPDFMQNGIDNTKAQKGSSVEKQQQEKPVEEEQQSSDSGSTISGRQLLSGAASSAMTLFGFLGNMLLVFIYVFFFLLYRNKLKKSLLKMVPEDQKERTAEIITKSIKVAKAYLSGRFILIVFLAIFYSVGLLLLGVNYAIFVGIIAAVLSLIPYFGNFIGGGIALLFALISGGSLAILLGVLGVFVAAQFIESYLLEPYVIGKKVELNPIVIIIIVILGQSVWGVMGMILAIPVTGILKVISDAVPVLQPLGYLLGNEGLDDDGDGLMKKLKQKLNL